MAKKPESRDTAYKYREDNEPHKQTGNIDSRNNNTNNDDRDQRGADEETMERANDTGIGDSGLNDDKLTNFTSNHSADA